MMKRFSFHARLILALILLCPLTAMADQLFLKPGQSKTLRTKGRVNTVFISDPSVADYKVLNENTIVLYAKVPGISEVTAYDADTKILADLQINVDSFLGDINQRIVVEFPGSQVVVKSFISSEGKSYILTGTVPDEETRGAVYQLVGSVVGKESRDLKVNYNTDDRETSEVFFMTKTIYSNVINRLQLPSPNQVNVKLSVVEVSKKFTDTLGIEWSNLTLSGLIKGSGVVNDPGVFSLIGLKRGFDAENISTTISAVNNDSLARILAQPNLTVLSGEVASFLVGGEIPLLVQSKEGTTIQYKEYGIRLNVAAKVEKKQKIKLLVSNEISSVLGSYAYNNYSIPQIKTRRSSSTIEVADGDSFVIGGLLNEEDVESLTKVPFISDIPILGALARKSHTERKKTELVVFATVDLVKPVSSASRQKIKLPEYHRSSSVQLFFNSGVDKNTREGRLDSDARSFMERGGFAK
ncbi:type II and III secretion system protein family protein [Symbiopectobacterium purcellii]|uniref:type II and III secretion system protein family protein n=1 Tax=Symbiopectobacterium purcellii TaxID=2871826 RepID=UPI003F843DCC